MIRVPYVFYCGERKITLSVVTPTNTAVCCLYYHVLIILENEMNIGKFLPGLKWIQLVFASGAVMGAVVGAVGGFGAGLVAGALTAPKEGKKTREDIANKFDEVVSSAKSNIEQFSNAAKQTAERTTSGLDDDDLEDFNSEAV
jgi:hypothetical protein